MATLTFNELRQVLYQKHLRDLKNFLSFSFLFFFLEEGEGEIIKFLVRYLAVNSTFANRVFYLIIYAAFAQAVPAINVKHINPLMPGGNKKVTHT